MAPCGGPRGEEEEEEDAVKGDAGRGGDVKLVVVVVSKCRRKDRCEGDKKGDGGVVENTTPVGDVVKGAVSVLIRGDDRNRPAELCGRVGTACGETCRSGS